MSAKVRKAMIMAAGSGTRFHPITKAVPKEMLPVIDKPILHYVVEDILASGICEIIIVTTAFKEPLIKQYFELHPGLGAEITFVHQNGHYGTATPVANVEHLMNKEPFALLCGDEIFAGDRPRVRQLMDVYERYQGPVFGVIQVDDEGANKYGIVEPISELKPGIFQINNLIEKPGPENTSSRLAALGAYILTPEIYDHLPLVLPSPRGELELTDAMKMLMQKQPHYAVRFSGQIFDTGTKESWLNTNIEFARKRDDINFN
ncbi:MAG: sugar phosphate nucleotidyltransferase [Patescibacteria group bacterium]|nr:NTP transferase domain-containing protein [Patescibacteria group bacterium]MBU2509486.1 NTP transferase domain-containing protein [Patescibacteria group bacterium]